MASASSTSSSVHWSSSMLTSSSWRVRSFSISAFSSSVGSAGLGMDAPEPRGGAPVDVGHRLGPLPAGRELVGGRLELLHGELDEQRRVLQPDPVLVLIGEEVAQHGAAGGLVGGDADEARHGRAGRHPLLGQQALHLPGGGAVALARDLLPDRPLAVVIGGDRERLQRLEVDLVGAVGVEQLGRGVAEPEPLLHQALGDAEARGDGSDGGAVLRELRLNATTWSAGCMAMRMTFSASESSPASPFAATLHGTGWRALRPAFLDERNAGPRGGARRRRRRSAPRRRRPVRRGGRRGSPAVRATAMEAT